MSEAVVETVVLAESVSFVSAPEISVATSEVEASLALESAGLAWLAASSGSRLTAITVEQS